MVNGLIDRVDVFLMNVYAPNDDEPSFIRTILSIILQHSSGTLLLGDFNCVMSQHLDRQPVSSTTSRMSKMLAEQNLAWWTLGETNTLKAKILPFFHIGIPYTPEQTSFLPPRQNVRSSQLHYQITLLSCYRGTLATHQQLNNGD